MSPEFQNSTWKVLRWLLLGILVAWAALALNAWRYFSDSGFYGGYLSARYSLEMLNVPAEQLPDELEGRVALSRDELKAFTQRSVIRFQNDTRPELRAAWQFTGPNSIYKSGGVGMPVMQEDTYFLSANRLCFYEGEFYGIWCEKIYSDQDGRLFKYFRGIRGVAPGWSLVIVEGGK